MTGGDPWVEIDPEVHPGEPLSVAILTRRFPKLSEPFILHQVTGLLDARVDVEVFAWTDGGDETIHREVGGYGFLSRTRHIQMELYRELLSGTVPHRGALRRRIGAGG